MASKLAAVLKEHRVQLVSALIQGHGSPRENRFLDPPDVFADRVGEGLDLLVGHIEGRRHFDALYAGQRMFEIVRPEEPYDENLKACRRAVTDDGESLRRYLAPLVDSQDLAKFVQSYSSATAGITTEASRHVRTLFIGDCIMAEIGSFLLGPLASESVSIDPFPINSRDLSGLKSTLDELALQEYDVIFLSPFSHARTVEIETLLDPQKTFMPGTEREALVGSVIDQTRVIIDYLAKRFECPIYVHNAAFLARSSSRAKASAVSLLTKRNVSYARDRVNTWLADYVLLHNSRNYQQLFVLDENRLAIEHGRTATGRYIYASPFQHATVFSQLLAKEYWTRICTIAHLVGKKLVVCDLDNTIWDGIIGEGSVAHFHDRQSILKRLKDSSGVVLSIASKNDPSAVHFRDGTLSLDDFVAPQISWNSKTEAIAKIKRTLNLQTRHMVFLDDRPDERALIQESQPDILVLDPCEKETWMRMSIWSELTAGSSELDRTKMYQQQAERDLSVDQSHEMNNAEALKKLGLVFSIRLAPKNELKRVAELINRTNQWNLTGSRTSFAQVKTWYDSTSFQIITGSASDRFGDMGTVCVAVVKLNENDAEILTFVLSCRVFGYGVETAVLKEVGRLAQIGSQRKALVGQYRSTNQNQPCRNMYRDHGFVESAGVFRWNGCPPICELPWASITAQ